MSSLNANNPITFDSTPPQNNLNRANSSILRPTATGIINHNTPKSMIQPQILPNRVPTTQNQLLRPSQTGTMNFQNSTPILPQTRTLQNKPQNIPLQPLSTGLPTMGTGMGTSLNKVSKQVYKIS